MILPDELREIMPLLPHSKAEAYIGLLNAAMQEFGIITPEREAAFLAQLAHESGQLRYWHELASGAAYDTGPLAARLGNTPEADGDGERYKGRGPIQITGRANYEACAAALGIDCVAHPELLELPENGFRSSAWFWQTHGLNELADVENFRLITKKINGGYNGYTDRLGYWQRAKTVLGVA